MELSKKEQLKKDVATFKAHVKKANLFSELSLGGETFVDPIIMDLASALDAKHKVTRFTAMAVK